ncbi:MAG: ATP/GTP-binding protein [Promethearchaeota archaeon]
MFESIDITQYRSIKNLKIENFKQFNLVVGATNIGKTSILEALFLAINPDNLSLIFTVNSSRKIPYTSNFLTNLFFKADPLNKIKIAAITKEKENNTRVLEYSATSNQQETIAISDDSSIPEISTKTSVIDKLIVTINDVPKYEFSIIPIRDLEKKGGRFVIPYNKKILEGEPYKMTFNGRFEHVFSYTDSFSSKYDGLVENGEKDDFLNLIREIDPDIKTIEKTDNGILIDYGFKKLIPIEVLGKGMIKVINSVAAIFNTKNGVVLIDEIENGMHYELLDLFWDAIYKTASKYNVQIIGTTHSYDCIEAFYKKHQTNEICLYRIEKEKDIHVSVKYNTEEIKTLIEENIEIR